MQLPARRSRRSAFRCIVYQLPPRSSSQASNVVISEANGLTESRPPRDQTDARTLHPWLQRSGPSACLKAFPNVPSIPLRGNFARCPFKILWPIVMLPSLKFLQESLHTRFDVSVLIVRRRQLSFNRFARNFSLGRRGVGKLRAGTREVWSQAWSTSNDRLSKLAYNRGAAKRVNDHEYEPQRGKNAIRRLTKVMIGSGCRADTASSAGVRWAKPTARHPGGRRRSSSA